jgi:hypothetical protein
MAWQFTTNVLVDSNVDKIGMMWMSLKAALVASGRWRVRGSGDGKAAFQLMGQTAGVAGSFDIFTASPPWNAAGMAYNTRANSISNASAWLVLEEIASGRVYVVQRDAGAVFPETSFVVAAAGVATTGASATVLPARTGSQATLNPSGTYPTNQGDYNPSSASQAWLQFAVDNSVRPGNVSPWWFAMWNKTSNRSMWASMWLQLVDVDPGTTNPVVAAGGNWSNVFGTVGDGAQGPTINGSIWKGGNGWLPCNISYRTNVGIGASPPLYQQLSTDSKYRTERPWILQPSVGSRIVGRVEDAYLNKVAREYPATYGIAGAEPRLTLGHLILPWTATAPESSP